VLRDANLKKDPKLVKEALKHLHTMRDAWKEVMDKTANGATVTGKVQVS
jgi:flagellar protein FliS